MQFVFRILHVSAFVSLSIIHFTRNMDSLIHMPYAVVVPAWKILFSGNAMRGRIVTSVVENVADICQDHQHYLHDTPRLCCTKLCQNHN